MSSIYIRKAKVEDLSKIMEIIDAAKALLKKDGSPQWQDGSPNTDTLRQDIQNNECWLLMVGKEIAGTATLLTSNDPHYDVIKDGHWKNTTEQYATIHRIAISSKFRGMSLSKFFFSNLISIGYQQGLHNFRIDTHEMNRRMQKLITDFDFEYTGIIYVNDREDGRRVAFELNL